MRIVRSVRLRGALRRIAAPMERSTDHVSQNIVVVAVSMRGNVSVVAIVSVI